MRYGRATAAEGSCRRSATSPHRRAATRASAAGGAPEREGGDAIVPPGTAAVRPPAEPTPPPLPPGGKPDTEKRGVSEALLHFILLSLALRPVGTGSSASEPAVRLRGTVTWKARPAGSPAGGDAPPHRPGPLPAAPRGGRRRRGWAAAGRDPALPAARRGTIQNGGPATTHV